MPIYEYICGSCGEEFEEMVKFSDPPITRHSCSSKSKVKRKLSLTSFQLKGGGWYEQGYSDQGKNGKSPKSEGEAKEAKSTEAKQDKAKTTEAPASCPAKNDCAPSNCPAAS